MATLTGAIAIGYVNRASGKTITATTAASGYPASKLNNPVMSQRWRSTTGSLTNQTLIADLTASTDIDIVGLIGYNGQNSSTRTVKTSENSDLSAPEYDSASGAAFDTTYPQLQTPVQPFGRNLVHFPGSTKNSRYAGITLNDSGNPDNQLKGSVFWIGPIWQPADGFSLESEAFKIRHEPIGQPGAERYVRILEVEFVVLTEAEAVALESVCLAKLRSGRLLVVPRPTLPATFLAEAIYCTLTELPTRGAIPAADGLRWKVVVPFREVED